VYCASASDIPLGGGCSAQYAPRVFSMQYDSVGKKWGYYCGVPAGTVVAHIVCMKP